MWLEGGSSGRRHIRVNITEKEDEEKEKETIRRIINNEDALIASSYTLIVGYNFNKHAEFGPISLSNLFYLFINC